MKPSVLITIDWFDPAYKAGGPISSIVNLINHLHKDFDFYVFTGSTVGVVPIKSKGLYTGKIDKLGSVKAIIY